MPIDRAAFKERLLSPEPIIAPGVYDGLSARIADQHGFEALYLSGYGVSASLLAKPDAGFLTAEHMQFRIESLCDILTTPLIADADTGFGGTAETAATVKAYEQAGAAGIQIEDQQIPKRCGHIAGREVVSREDAVAKIKAAADARTDPNFLIVARTDAREQNGLAEAITRGHLFHEAGADIIFIESPEDETEFQTIGKELGGKELDGIPLLANMVKGGRSPIIPLDRLAAYGFRVIIYPVAAMAIAAATLEQAYKNIDTASTAQNQLSFKRLSSLVGFDEVLK